MPALRIRLWITESLTSLLTGYDYDA
jgi:hypothetical protein